MNDTSTVAREPGGEKPARRPLVDDELADQLLGRAQAEGPSCWALMGCCRR